MKTTAGVALWTSLILAGCAARAPLDGAPGTSQSHSRPSVRHLPDQALRQGDRDLIVMTAVAQVGKPYQYGGNGPDAFDCSGLVRYAYGIGGAKTARTTTELYTTGRAVSQMEARPGDLFFYALDPSRSGPSHVVFYLGDGEGIHAPSGGGSIRAVKLDIPYFSRRYLGARRLLE